MKKILTIGLTVLCSISDLAQARSHYDHSTVSIAITNASPYLCTLQNYELKQGRFYFSFSVADFIPPYSTTSSIILDTCNSAEIDLSYTCGDNRRITLNVTEIANWFSHDLTARVVSSQDMSATYRQTDNTFHNHVQWRLESNGQ